MKLTQTSTAEAGLVLTTLLWGLTFPMIRLGVADLDGRYFVALRFIVATLGFLPLLFFFKIPKHEMRKAIKPGILTGFLISLTYLFQTIGLETVSSPRAAFLTASYVILVPLLSPLFRRGKPKLFDLFSSLIAIFGLYLIMDPGLNGISKGDVWILSCALITAFAIHVMGKILVRSYDLRALAFWQIVGVTIISTLSLLTAKDPKLNFDMNQIVSILVCALVVTIGAFLLQANCQKHLTPERTALIYCLEPIFAILFGLVLLNEMLNAKALLGGLIILLAVSSETLLPYIHRLKLHYFTSRS